ncbi:hypothetical protein O3M35_007779 [Rhynocoris fuscipes]|uniref:Uncharacterized protein n=1 Tax=Rhynocoris fuscipes TaxID=488301 RepID=A0AAW1DE61_9HEMI
MYYQNTNYNHLGYINGLYYIIVRLKQSGIGSSCYLLCIQQYLHLTLQRFYLTNRIIQIVKLKSMEMIRLLLLILLSTLEQRM